MILSQENIIRQLQDRVEVAPVYQKFTTVFAREAIVGEQIVTSINGIQETKNVASKGDFVVRNRTQAQEEYIVKADTFHRRYEDTNEKSGNWSVFQAKGKCKAVQVDEEVLNLLGVKETFYFMASWGEKMRCEKGDILAVPLEQKESKVYRIAKEEFLQTYRLID